MLKVVLRSTFSNDARCVQSLLSARHHAAIMSSVHATRRCITERKEETSLTKAKSSSEVGTPITFENVKETTKTASYLGVILVGVGVTGIMFFAIFRELFSSKSSNTVYTRALERCSQDTKVRFALGEPLKGFGEETRRGRRRHVSHVYYERDGVNYLRMKFYIQGIRKRGTVHLEMQENKRGDFAYRYLFVQLDDYPRDIIIIEDNRHEQTTTELYPMSMPDTLQA